MEHMAEKECYHNAKTEYKRCSKSECGMDHHPLLHWALIVACLFQVQVVPESYPAGAKQFQLWQWAVMNKVDVSLVFDNSSNHTMVTEEFCQANEAEEDQEWFFFNWI
jgi:hypothetical protein